MRPFLRIVVLVVICQCAVVVAQNTTKRIFLSPKSTITTAEVAEGFSKNCPNVV